MTWTEEEETSMDRTEDTNTPNDLFVNVFLFLCTKEANFVDVSCQEYL